ncbi:BRCA2-interacting transcriptional repressor EMSY isoform X2 [Leptopilina boulardi]|uniref:BRCA2-interacting transcriptional repressor EMSY isoform X2 n=1 Tax=Leptopilina boulardi TaxID=63433 RepID=UPI0021F55E09|nr:BRCA2-interacting transcriptional repressor EMSY isoform X2 [Leptopilina boulardi]
MLPGKLDMSRDECRKYLRSLELDAYASMVSVLRAQGPFTHEKRKLLEELAGVLHISNERHRAEIRRAVNDDRLTNVAEQLTGPNTGTDWATEGRRIVPLIPRLKARNAFTTLANTLSLVTAMANKKQPLPEKIIKDSNVTMETDVDSPQTFLSEEETSASSSIEPEFHDKKRKRSITESSDTEGSTCSKEKIANKSESLIVPNLNLDNTKFSLLTNPSCSKNIESPTSLPSSDAHRHNISNKNSPNEINVDNSTTVVTSQNITVVSVGVSSNLATNSTVSKETNTVPTAQTVQYTSAAVSSCIGSKNKVNLLPSQVKTAVVGPRRISVTMPPNIVQPTTSKVEQVKLQNVQINSDKDIKLIPVTNNLSKIEMEKIDDASTSKTVLKTITHIVPSNVNTSTGDQQTILDINARLTNVTSGNANSSGPGPPCVTASPTTLTCKTMTPVKPNSHPTAKMILNSKAISIDPKSKTNFGGKRSLIVLQKGMKKIMLSHGGKEARGKVISSVALVPRIPSSNGEQSDTDCAKLINKPGSKMVVLDIRQDVLDKNRIFPQRLETPNVIEVEAKTATLIPANNLILNDQGNNRTTIVENDSQLNNSSLIKLVNNDNEESHKMSPNNVFEDTDFAAIIEKASDKEPLFIYNDKETVIDGTLDPQTGIYEIHSSDDAIKNVQCEETLSSEELGQFSTTLETEIINSESSQCTEGDNTSSISEEVNDTILVVEKLDKLINS